MKNIAALPWLPSAPDDFRAQCKSIASAEDVRFLATHALDLTQLGQLARAMERLPTLDPLTPFRLAIMSSTTVDFLLPHLKVSGTRHGLGMELFASPYGQVMQQVMDSDSEVNRFKADAVLLYLDHHFFPGVLEIGNADALRAAVQVAIRQTSALRQALRQTGTTVIVTTMAPAPLSLFGHLDTRIPGTGRTFADAYNAALLESLEQSADVLMDVASLAETVGLYTWHDARQWLLAKIPFSMECVPLFAEHLARIVACLCGKARKCLVLDLDNTVWGGVIGDDGLDGIKIGNGSALGEAHLEVQRAALSLRQRGIVLAVSSKNNDDIARLPFQAHPDMLLREEHIAVFQANWHDKATNLVAIAKTLNIGIDALVFLDDNPAERALVRQVLPQVAVPELPNDAALFPQILMNAGYFETLYFSDEDRQRAEQYQANGIRASLEQISADLPTYLRSLQMVIQFSAFDIVGRARIAQLINKSNQFNLTTRRYTEADIDAMLSDPSLFTLQVRLADRFGDNGMISVIICRPKDQVLLIDTWLMSCRVLKRQVEFAVLNEIMIEAKSRGIHQVHGTYIPSGKNELVRNHYAELGFTKVCAGDDGATEWTMDVAGYQIQDIPMVVQKVTSSVQST